MVKDKDKDKKKHLDNGTEHLAWWGRERSAKRVTVSPAEAISGPLYKPPPCAPLYIFVHLCTKPPPTFPEQISQWSSGRTIGCTGFILTGMGAFHYGRKLGKNLFCINCNKSIVN